MRAFLRYYPVMKCLRAIALLLMFPILSVMAQEEETGKVHLKGRVVDENEEAVSLCIVRVEGTAIATTAGLDGTYRLEFQTADSVVLHYSMMGYEPRRRVLKAPKGNLTLNIVMHSSSKVMEELTVADTRRQLGSTQQLNTKDLKRLPSTTGNAVEELVATQAGVSTHNELSSQYNVRGGSFDENCVYVNGVEIYRPLLISSGQQEGLSVINSDMVERVDFSAGGFEAKCSTSHTHGHSAQKPACRPACSVRTSMPDTVSATSRLATASATKPTSTCWAPSRRKENTDRAFSTIRLT